MNKNTTIMIVSREEVLSERSQIVNKISKLAAKIVSITCLYGYRVSKTNDKEKIDYYVKRMVRLNAIYAQRIVKFHKKLLKLEKVLGE